MQLLRQMLPSAALSAAVTGALLYVFARLWKSASRFGGAVAIAGGYIAGHVLAAGWSPFPPRHATQWLFWFAIIGVLAAAADVLVRPGRGRWKRESQRSEVGGQRSEQRRARPVTWAIICAIACRLILEPKFRYAWSAAEGWLWVLAIGLGVVLLAWSLDRVERGPLGSATLFSVTTLLCGGACVALMLSGSLLLGQLAAVLMAIALTCFVMILYASFAREASLGNLGRAEARPSEVGMAESREEVARFGLAKNARRRAACFERSGAAAPLSLVFAGLLISGFFYAELPAGSALLLALAPSIALLPVGRRVHSNSRVLACRLALVAIQVAIAVVLALHASPPLDY